MHAHIGTVFPNLQPPSFQCTDITDHSMRLHYYSERAGLAPMVIGLLKGLGTMFNQPIAVVHAVSRAAGANHDEFVLEYTAE